MARQPRFVLPGQPQHVIQRGNNRQNIFLADSDYDFYLEKLGDAADKHQCDIHAYVLMTNHVHLLVTPHLESSIGKMVQMVGRYYVQYFNYCYRRTGTLWEGRYKASLIDSERYLLTCMRYIELNPVRATNMVDHPSDYQWSSYAYNAVGAENDLLTPHPEYRNLGKTDVERQSAYRHLFRAQIPNRALEEIREAINRSNALGSDQYIREIEKRLKRPAKTGQHGGDRKSAEFQGV